MSIDWIKGIGILLIIVCFCIGCGVSVHSNTMRLVIIRSATAARSHVRNMNLD